jgi:predicted nucleic acid-binding protein
VTAFVLDASVTMRWLLASTNNQHQRYARDVLGTLENTEALVPELWHLEVTNVLLSYEQDGELTAIDSERFLQQLEALPIRTDASTTSQAFTHTMTIARSHRLTSYDAAYIELAVREGLPIASLDKQMRKCAASLEIPLYLEQ